MMRRQVAGFLTSIWVGLAGVAEANWTASGTFRYVDREFDQNGFTGLEPAVPIRFADVQVRDANANGGAALLATGATDANGNFSIFVSDNKTRTVYVRALTTSTATPGLFIKVQNKLTPKVPYAVASANIPNHAPSANLNFGNINAAPGSGGEGFNIFDTGIYAIDFIAALTGSRPGSANLLTLEWDTLFGDPFSHYNYSNKTVSVGDNSAYNDTVIGHETGHYAYHLHSATDNPGGEHHLLDCNQDLRLAFEEGRATFFGQSVRRFFNLSRPDLYVRTTGAPGAGNLDFYFNVETETPFYCDGASSEVAAYAAFWDINDSAATADGTPGIDDDTLARPDADSWDVHKNYIPTAVNRTMEDFWDGWFVLGKGFKSSMIAAFQLTNIENYPDTGEPNDGIATALPITATGAVRHHTYFADVNSDGAGETDVDFFSFNATAGRVYTIETQNLWGKANTSLELLDSNGTTVLAANDDRAAGDPSSLISYTPSTSGTLYIRSFHSPDFGVYGSYDLIASGNPAVDADLDGYNVNLDCNDNNPNIHPGAPEVCNGIDDNCINGIDDGGGSLCADADSCTNDLCGGTAGCSHSPAPNGLPCSNGNACITGETCLAGLCQGGSPKDADADAHVDALCGGNDCNDSNAQVWLAPVEVTNLLLTQFGPTDPAWDSQASLAGPETRYDLVSGPLPLVSGFEMPANTCLLPSSPATSYSDTRPEPGEGTGWWYLARARNSCGIGTYGSASDSSPRSVSACP